MNLLGQHLLKPLAPPKLAGLLLFFLQDVTSFHMGISFLLNLCAANDPASLWNFTFLVLCSSALQLFLHCSQVILFWQQFKSRLCSCTLSQLGLEFLKQLNPCEKCGGECYTVFLENEADLLEKLDLHGGLVFVCSNCSKSYNCLLNMVVFFFVAGEH